MSKIDTQSSRVGTRVEKTDKKISVIVPVYNTGNRIIRCVDSIINQTYRNFEIILVDDGSSDESSTICDSYSRENAFIKVVHQDNKGVSAARNAGLEVSEGEFITFIDADDFVSPDYLEILLIGDEDLAIAGTSYTDPEGNITSVARLPEKSSEEQVTATNLVRWFEQGFLYSACTCMFRRLIIDSLELKFNESLTRGEDTVFVIEYAEECRKIRFINKAIYFYVQYGSGGSSSYRIKRQNIISLDYLHQYIASWLKKNKVKSELFDDRSFWIKRELRAYLYDVLRSGKIADQEKKEYFQLLYILKSYQDLDNLFEGTNMLIRIIIKLKSPGILLLCSKAYRLVRGFDRSGALSE